MSNNHQQPARLLVVDDEPDLLTLYEITLKRCGYQVQTAADLEQARALLAEQRFDVLVTDMRLPDGQGLELIEWLQASQRKERGIVITAYGSADNAVRALKAGAFDYLSKPVNLDQFRSVVAQAIHAGESVHMVDLAPSVPEPPKPADTQTPAAAPPDSAAASAPVAALKHMVGGGTMMQQLKATLVKVAPSMAPVLILGESGTGKELVARALHQCSHRADKPFVAVNCGAIPETLLEAEFFGAKKGAYTGAVADREGLFQSATGGTLFLDEIGDLPLAMQAKLLRAIQERQVRPLGAAQEIHVDVRIVSATHKNLVNMVQAGQFRQDLYYRLNVIEMRVPPLRERREDIPALAQALLDKITEGGSGDHRPFMTAAFLERLQSLPLPGNVRELENTLHRCWALSDGHTLDAPLLDSATPIAFAPAEHAPPAAQTVASPPSAAPVPLPPSGFAAAPASESAPVMPAPTGDAVERPLQAHEMPLPCDLDAFVGTHEKALLLRALQQTKFNRTAAAALLGLNLRQIRYRMERLGIHDDDDTP
ncbi:MAG: sigma-54 dependent transcriptional regulator [Brachymonas sp.]|nr:sigma-54 dependent transcriptional regulator [Brachymonas sp.]